MRLVWREPSDGRRSFAQHLGQEDAAGQGHDLRGQELGRRGAGDVEAEVGLREAGLDREAVTELEGKGYDRHGEDDVGVRRHLSVSRRAETPDRCRRASATKSTATTRHAAATMAVSTASAWPGSSGPSRPAPGTTPHPRLAAAVARVVVRSRAGSRRSFRALTLTGRSSRPAPTTLRRGQSESLRDGPDKAMQREAPTTALAATTA